MADKNLVMNFMNEEGKKVAITLTGIKETLTEAEVSAAMDTILEKNIFHTTGGDLMVKDSAQVVERSVEDLIVK